MKMWIISLYGIAFILVGIEIFRILNRIERLEKKLQKHMRR